MDFFISPFSSPVGQRIEKGTSENPGSDQLVLQLEICDIINETEEGARDAVKALRKRLFGNRNWPVVLNALTILDICVKNCGHRFHVLVAKKDFVDQLVALSQAKAAAPSAIQEKTLGLIQAWADSFRGRLDLDAVCGVCDELRRQGIEFPAQDLDTLAPIYTPHRSVAESQPSAPQPSDSRHDVGPEAHPDAFSQNQSEVPATVPSQQQEPHQSSSTGAYVAATAYPAAQVLPASAVPQHVHVPAAVPAAVLPSPGSPTAVAKLRSELDMVHRNVAVFNDMMECLQPGQEATADFDLLSALRETCRDMQGRVFQLLSLPQYQESLMGDLLAANDVLNASFNVYQSYETARNAAVTADNPVGSGDGVDGITAAASTTDGEQTGVEPPSYTAMASIVTSPTSAASGNASTAGTTGTETQQDEFDMFATRRQEAFAAPSNTYERPSEGVSFADRFGSRIPSYQASVASATGSCAEPQSTAPLQECGMAAASAAPAQEACTSAAASAPMMNTDSATVSEWLASNDLATDMEVVDEKAVEEIEPMTTDEFDMFLSARTSGSKKSSSSKASAPGDKKPARRARPMMQPNEDDDNDGLFAL